MLALKHQDVTDRTVLKDFCNVSIELFQSQAELISFQHGSKEVCRLWAEIEAHKWCDLELNLSKTATKAIKFY